MYIEVLGGPYAGVGSIVAFCDTNATRMSYYANVLEAPGAPAPPQQRISYASCITTPSRTTDTCAIRTCSVLA
jgi:hypothetical protein